MSKIYRALQQESLRFKGDTDHLELDYHDLSPRESRGEMISLSCLLDNAISAKKPRIVQFVGALPGEGTSLLAREFARVVVAESRKAVLLLTVDKTQNDSEKESNFETDLYPILDTKEFRLLIYPLSMQLTYETLSNSDEENSPLGKAKNSFDLIVIDCPAMKVFPESLLISSKVDGVFLVMQAEDTPWPVTKDVKERIVQAGGNILALILNKQRDYLPEFLRTHV